MEFEYTQEQLALQDTLRRFYARDYSFEHRRAVAQSAEGFDRKAWSTFAVSGGLLTAQSLCGASRMRDPLPPPRLSVPRNVDADAQAVEIS